MKKSILGAASVVAVTLALGLAEPISAEPAANGQKVANTSYQVKIDNFSFGPQDLTVPVGATVTWVNQDDVPHTVTSTEGTTLKSPVLDTDDKFTFTFTHPGAYPYYCTIHPKMTAKVIVK